MQHVVVDVMPLRLVSYTVNLGAVLRLNVRCERNTFAYHLNALPGRLGSYRRVKVPTDNKVGRIRCTGTETKIRPGGCLDFLLPFSVTSRIHLPVFSVSLLKVRVLRISRDKTVLVAVHTRIKLLTDKLLYQGCLTMQLAHQGFLQPRCQLSP